MQSSVDRRRRHLLAGMTAAVLPRVNWAGSGSNPDVVVVGAGAAGLAAARTLLGRGLALLCLKPTAESGAGRGLTLRLLVFRMTTAATGCITPAQTSGGRMQSPMASTSIRTTVRNTSMPAGVANRWKFGAVTC